MIIFINTTIAMSMTSFRIPVLFRPLTRNLVLFPIAVHRVLSLTVPCTRPFSQLYTFRSTRISVRLYTTVPPDDVRVYTFKEIESICKRLKENYIIGIVPRIQADGRCSRTSRAPAGGKDPECNQSSTVKSSRVIESF